MKKHVSPLSVGIACLLLLTACASGQTSESTAVSTVQEESAQPTAAADPVMLNILNIMGEEVEFPKIPQRAVVVGYENAEVMAKLDLQDKIVGLTSSMYTPEQVYPDLYEKLKDVKVLPGDNAVGVGIPSFEAVLREEADFLYCMSYHVSANFIATPMDLKENGIGYYIMRGTYGDSIGLEAMYEDIRSIGKIFGAEEKAEKVIAEYKIKVDEIKNKFESEEKKRVFIFDYQDKTGIMTPGKKGFANSLVELAGGKNVFDDFDTEFDVATLEQIIEKDPEYIVFIEYNSDGDRAKDKIAYIESLPELSEVSAVKNKNYIELDGIEYFPSLHNVDAVEKMAAAMHPDFFQ